MSLQAGIQPSGRETGATNSVCVSAFEYLERGGGDAAEQNRVFECSACERVLILVRICVCTYQSEFGSPKAIILVSPRRAAVVKGKTPALLGMVITG